MFKLPILRNAREMPGSRFAFLMPGRQILLGGWTPLVVGPPENDPATPMRTSGTCPGDGSNYY